jgi:hypothetical protein
MNNKSRLHSLDIKQKKSLRTLKTKVVGERPSACVDCPHRYPSKIEDRLSNEYRMRDETHQTIRYLMPATRHSKIKTFDS